MLCEHQRRYTLRHTRCVKNSFAIPTYEAVKLLLLPIVAINPPTPLESSACSPENDQVIFLIIVVCCCFCQEGIMKFMASGLTYILYLLFGVFIILPSILTIAFGASIMVISCVRYGCTL